ncbi:MAG TPA: extracellular solute-binding protein, partial [Microcella sp.]|nr:extracellular solute-binding protein [Microcella sp.]
MRKWIVSGAAFAATALLVAGCASSTPESPETPDGSGEAPAEQVTLTYGVWSQEETMQLLIDAFEEQNPGITVELQVNPFGEYWTALQVAAQGGTAPDAFWMLGDRFQVYAANDQLLPLGSAIEEAGVDMSVYPSALVDLFTYEGEMYGLPKDFDTIGLWYNK